MNTSENTLWKILKTYTPTGHWIHISELYKVVERNYHRFTQDDLVPETSYNKEPTWHRNVRDVLQIRRKSGEILYDGKANYKIDRPYVWQMIKEAIETIPTITTYSRIKDYINRKWSNVNQETITDQIIVLTVNHNSRIHFPENHKPRMSDSNSPYDLLFTTGRGKVEKYTKVKHGLWEIYLTESQQLAVREVKDELIKHIYTPCDIIWIKNVTSKTTDSAYLYIDEPIFVLHFPNVHYPNIMTPKIGELILIYQKVGGIPSFTHIVTPIDYIPIEDIQRSDYRYGRRVKIIAKTNRDNIIHVSSTSWKRIKFGGFTQGNACKIENIKNVGNIDELQYDLWQRFSNYFSRDEQQSVFSTSALLNEIQVSHPGMSVREGQLRLVKHLLKERNRKIIAEKKAEAIRNGSLLCEVCEFSFKEVFNKEFIECHHLTPIGKPGVRDTTLDDLALVCANCHRMLHTKFENKYLTLEELRKRKDRPKAHP